MMKIALFALGFLTFAQGIHLEEGSSMDVEFDHDEDFGGYGYDNARKAIRLRYRPIGGRNARKIIEVHGNCCWRFYQR